MRRGGVTRYPHAPRTESAQEFHGVVVADFYRWLEDPGDERTIAWTAAQEALFAEERATWPDTAWWHATLSRLARVPLTSLPRPRGDRVFFTHREPDADHPRLVVSERDAGHGSAYGAERTLVDPLALDPSGRTVLEAWHPSIEGDLVAVQLSAGGTEDSLLRVLDVATGAVVDGPIDRVRKTPVAWLPGGRAFYYVRRLAPELNPGEERYHRRVHLHRVGTDPDEDVLIFGDGRDRTCFYTVAVTPDGRWLTVSSTVGTAPATDLWLADLHEGTTERPCLRPVQENVPARSRITIAPGTAPRDPLWLRTDLDAPRGRIVVTTAADPTPRTWRTLIAERPDAVLDDFVPLTGAGLPRPLALVSWSRHAVSEMTLHDLADGRELARVPLSGSGTGRAGEIGSVGRFAVPPEGGDEAWFGYWDHTTPPRVLRYDARSGAVRPWSRPGPYGPANGPAGGAVDGPAGGAVDGAVDGAVATSQVTFESKDGTRVRMFVLSPSGAPDRPRPAILTGYGGFGASMTPGYMPQALAWVRAGGIYAIACLRGGGEEGERWHRDGMGVRKQNVFDDFDAATDHLVEHGWTGPDRLGVMGESNGGLLVGAALTRHPEKYAAAVCVAPLLDMLAYERLGMGPSWRAEYGSVRDPEEFRTLLAYSPYHRVGEGVPYPPVLFAVAGADTRVDPAHSRKMCALLQHASAGAGPILFRLERDTGHGLRAASKKIGLLADVLAFFARHLGLDPAGPV